jgi:hypothetical protein
MQIGHFWHLGCFCLILDTTEFTYCCEKSTVVTANEGEHPGMMSRHKE